MMANSKRALYRLLRSHVGRLAPLHEAFWRIQRALISNAVFSAAWKSVLERRRLRLHEISPVEDLGLGSETVLFPGVKESSCDEDAFLEDLLFLLHLAKSRQCLRVLEVGTYRAKTTYALHLNLPRAFIRSYDIRRIESPFRALLEASTQADLQIASFADSRSQLQREAPFDFIFIDGSHRLEHVLQDSEVAFEIIAPGGVIVWHDYRKNGFIAPDLQVPEALEILATKHKISGVKDTNCALFIRPAAESST